MIYTINKKEIPIDSLINSGLKIYKFLVIVAPSIRNLWGLIKSRKTKDYPVLLFIDTGNVFYGRVESLTGKDGISKSGYFNADYGWAKDRNGRELCVEGGIRELSEMLVERGIILIASDK